MKHEIKLIREFAYLLLVFIIASIAVSGLVTYFSQMKMYETICRDRTMEVGDYLVGLVLEDPEDFVSYQHYYESHYQEMRIPYDFTECNTARDEFFTAFRAAYPGKSYKIDIMPWEMPEELQNLYYIWRHEYWILTFEQARESFGLPYTYYLLPDDETHYTVYMIDGERTEDENHPGFLYLGDSYYEKPSEHELLWNTWHNGQRYDEVYEWNNEWGHTYSCYTPLLIDDECLGLVVTEINVEEVNSMIVNSTLFLVLQLGILLIFLTALLLFFLNRYHIRRINHLSEQISEFSSTRAYDIVDAIRAYGYGRDEIKQLSENTADMIRELKIHEGKVAQAAQFKSDFLANMSHEIRTPMNAVVALSDLALKQTLPRQSREYITQINTSANTMLVIINDILDFSRIEAGTMEIAPAEYKVVPMIRDVVQMTSLGLGDKPVVMKLNIAPDIPKCLRGDSARIAQVLNNVISNAVKFTKEGTITINIDYETLADDKINLMIRVADTGIGIRREDYDRIFESFSQINSNRNREVEGTGLGLAITQRLIKLMNGTIEVDSEYGIGSVFRICIPQEVIARKDTEAAQTSEKVPGRKSLYAPNARILVVDDNSVNLFVAKSLLGLYEIKATCVLSGEQALKIIEKKEFDLILMDYMMPQMDGIETMKRIREEYPAYQNIPIIAFTANAVEEARDLLLKEGMDDFIAKPVKSEELEAILKKWLPENVIS
ncbi:MAG: response regulator [Lachnospiraceae bacterium]|nr:response regulator [Lachnospiraceae bacterium]